MIIHYNKHKLVVMLDNERSDSLDYHLINHADILIYDGMYTDDEYAGKKGFGHSTFQEGARLALKVKPNRLIITHHNPASEDSVLREYEEETKRIYPHSNFARAGQTWEFPMPKPVEPEDMDDYLNFGIKERMLTLFSPIVKMIKNMERDSITH